MSGRISSSGRGRLRPAPHVRRCGRRRRVEEPQRRHQLRGGLRRSQPVHRRDHHRPGPSRHRLGGHGRGLGAQQRFGGRRHLRTRRRRREVEEHGSGRQRAHRQDHRRSHRSERSFTPRPWATCGTPTRSGACTGPPTAARPGSASSTSTRTPAAATSGWIPRTPDTVYAAMWEFRRSPDFFNSGGPGSGVYKSTDGGASWKRHPQRIARRAIWAASPWPCRRPTRASSTPSVEAEDIRLLPLAMTRARPGHQTSDQKVIKGRPFYFSLLIPDPAGSRARLQDQHRPAGHPRRRQDLRRRRRLGARRQPRPVDQSRRPEPHDRRHRRRRVHHPQPRATAGGTCPTCRCRSSTAWRSTTSEPYKVYGGLQDNGCWMAPSRSPGGHREQRLGESGRRRRLLRGARSARPDIVYWEWQGGNINRKDLRTGESKDIKPLPASGRARATAGTGTRPSPSARASPSGCTWGRSSCTARTDRGESWQVISADLTTNDPEEAAPGGIGRPDHRQHHRREPLHDLHHRRVAAWTRRPSGWAPTTATCR